MLMTHLKGSEIQTDAHMLLTQSMLATRYDHYERQIVDYVREATRKNIWYYRDRMSVPRGPCPLPVRHCSARAKTTKYQC